jgi:hypothetical protein
MLKVLEFIKGHKDWEELLSQAPYFIKISRDEMFGKRLIMLKYNQLDSDFNEEIVRECRGLILDEDSLEPVCVPFFKFGNYGESYCPEIDWESAVILEKRDGSLIKVVKLGEDYLISTNGCIDAFKAMMPDDILCPYKSYGDLFMKAMGNRLSSLKEGFTYMFELTSPYNRVVVPYDELEIALIGIRDNKSLQEQLICNSIELPFKLPKRYMFNTLEECIKSAHSLPYSEEGYVVVDKHFNRVKIKSLEYVNVHHLRGEGAMTEKRILDIIRQNEIAEYLIYFPEYKELFDEYKRKVDDLYKAYHLMWLSFSQLEFNSRKEIALFLQDAKDVYDMGFIFKMLDGKIKESCDFFADMSLDKFVDILHRYEHFWEVKD